MLEKNKALYFSFLKKHSITVNNLVNNYDVYLQNQELIIDTFIEILLKFQNDLLIGVFKNYVEKHKSVFYDLSLEKRMVYIENAIQKDMKLRNSMKGMIIGHFTVEEYGIYIENTSALNKRMMNMVKERLLSHIQLFEKPGFVAAV